MLVTNLTQHKKCLIVPKNAAIKRGQNVNAAWLILPELRSVICMGENSLKKNKTYNYKFPSCAHKFHGNQPAARTTPAAALQVIQTSFVALRLLMQQLLIQRLRFVSSCSLLPAGRVEILLSLFMLSLCNIFSTLLPDVLPAAVALWRTCF